MAHTEYKDTDMNILNVIANVIAKITNISKLKLAHTIQHIYFLII